MKFTGGRQRSPPNIVILVLDTARARNLSCYGNNRLTTPTLDTLAEKGIRFSRATSISPWTLPSHASLFTGVPPSVHNTNSLHRHLPSSLITLATLVQDYDYNTVGMSANPWFSSQFGIIEGFNKFHHLFGPFATESYREFVMELTDSSKSLPARGSAILSSQSLLELARNGLTAAHRQFVDRDDDGARKSVEYAREIVSRSEPFFLFANFLEPHLPYEPPKYCRKRFIPDEVTDERLESLNQDAASFNIRNIKMEPSDFDLLERLYDSEIYHVDRQIQRILDLIDEAGKRENTIIIVLGDHGDNIGDHGLMGHQYSIHETLTHIPLLLHYPGLFDGGEVVEERVSSLDVPATLSKILRDYGITNKQFHEQQYGVPLHDRTGNNRRIFVEYLNPMPPIKRLRAKSENPEFDVSQYDRQLRGVYDGVHKFVRGTDGHRALYNVRADPRESENLVDDQSERATEMESALESWVEEHVPESNTKTDTPGPAVKERLGDLGYL